MPEMTDAEAAAWAAEKVMGWRRVRELAFGVKWETADGSDRYTGSPAMPTDADFDPRADVRHALEMLEAWIDAPAKGTRTWTISRPPGCQVASKVTETVKGKVAAEGVGCDGALAIAVFDAVRMAVEDER